MGRLKYAHTYGDDPDLQGIYQIDHGTDFQRWFYGSRYYADITLESSVWNPLGYEDAFRFHDYVWPDTQMRVGNFYAEDLTKDATDRVWLVDIDHPMASHIRQVVNGEVKAWGRFRGVQTCWWLDWESFEDSYIVTIGGPQPPQWDPDGYPPAGITVGAKHCIWETAASTYGWYLKMLYQVDFLTEAQKASCYDYANSLSYPTYLTANRTTWSALQGIPEEYIDCCLGVRRNGDYQSVFGDWLQGRNTHSSCANRWRCPVYDSGSAPGSMRVLINPKINGQATKRWLWQVCVMPEGGLLQDVFDIFTSRGSYATAGATISQTWFCPGLQIRSVHTSPVAVYSSTLEEHPYPDYGREWWLAVD